MEAAGAPRPQRLHHASLMQRVKAVTSHAAAYIQRWWCGPDPPMRHEYGPGNHSQALTYGEPARISARLLVAAGRGPARVPTCEHALLHVPTKFYHLIAAHSERWFMAARLRDDLRFDKWQDDYDDLTRSKRKKGVRTARVDDFSLVLVRALSLFGAGELRALRVLDGDVLQLVTALLRTASASGGGPAPRIVQAMDALCAIQSAPCFSSSPDTGALAALLERHSATITELDVELSWTVHKQAASALACCARLESLTRAHSHDHGIWLGLSQLHTLRGVSLDQVSTAAIAAALPKLHTLHAFAFHEAPAQVAGFFTDLLPRLRVFHFYGTWPDTRKQPVTTTVAPLPLLEELQWAPPPEIARHEFLGAQPRVLHAPYALISQCWLGTVDGAASFLARVHDLLINSSPYQDPLHSTDVAQVLRAAPHLKKFHTDRRMQGDASWLAPTAPTHPAFEGLVHPRLREFSVVCATSEATSPDAEWVAHLRRRHFPVLRKLVINHKACVTPLSDNQNA